MKLFSLLRLAWNLAWFDNQARYSKTKLGELWIVLSVFLSSFVLSSVYGGLFGSEVTPGVSFFSYIALGLVFWNFLAEVINRGSNFSSSITQRLLNTVDSMNYLVLRSYLFLLQNFLVSFFSISLFLALTTSSVSLYSILLSLPFIGLFLIFSYAIFLFFVVVGYFVKDISEFTPVFTTLLFLASPILYPASRLQSNLFTSYNIFYHYIGLSRDCLLNSSFSLASFPFLLLQLVFISLVIFLMSFLLKKQRSAFVVRAE